MGSPIGLVVHYKVCDTAGSNMRTTRRLHIMRKENVGIQTALYTFPRDHTVQQLRNEVLTLHDHSCLRGTVHEAKLPR